MIVYITQINARLTFQTFDVKSGISDNYVIAMLRDQYGFMWVATLNGLNRYDGYQCKQYWVTDSDTYSNCLIIYRRTHQVLFGYVLPINIFTTIESWINWKVT